MRTTLIVLTLFLQTLLFPPTTQAQGNLSVTPTRVVFEGRTRSAPVTLINRGSIPVTYRVSFVRMRMSADGEFEEITGPEPGQSFADPYLRYAPRQVTLEPGKTQTVRLLLRKPADLPIGEYRSHLLLKAIPPEDAGRSLEAATLGESEIGVQIVPMYGAILPVILRHGELDAELELRDLTLERGGEDQKPALSWSFERRGGRSVYGDLTLSYLPERGPETVLQERKGVAVYTPNAVRSMRLSFDPPENVDLSSGRLLLRFVERGERDDALVAEAKIPLS